MNWLDRSIAAVSPRWAYKRAAWRDAMNVFDAGGRGRLNQGWNPSVGPNEWKKASERSTLRARAQDLENNSDLTAGILQAFNRNVVGTGIMLQAKIPHDVPGNEEGQINKSIEKLWKEYCKAENIDITATQSLEEISEMIIRRYVVDGGIFAVKVYVGNSKFPFKLQIRSVDELDTTVTAHGKNRVLEGVEVDDYNKPIAYHFKKYDGYLVHSTETVRISAEDVIFLFKKTNPQQIREVSQLVTAMSRIKDVNQFVEAISIKERVMACMAVFIKKDTPTGGVGRGVRQSSEQISYDGVSLSPGMIGELNPGDEVQTVIPSGQASNSREFITTLVRMIAAGLGLSYEAVSRDLSQVNYSSARQGLIEDRKVYKKMQKMIIDRLLTPVYLEFLDSMDLNGKLGIPGYSKNKEQYITHVWVPPGSTWIDPKKEADANKVALETNQDTLARICAERGEDWRDVITQRAAEKNLEKELMGESVKGGGDDHDPDEEDEDDDDAASAA
ncbi:phage portal protein [Paenibacillus provencensis]|uniref:Phage portal protein n=1 Tax=Paenibacillus provencensis TaxID=441151 RepID=A0ABW3PRW7_9BACL|nr:phage portal protein [Paenibacillus sp. MER 78]MCM3129008.1 phage portal protein [Paenibacillus sp. MER 78]